MTDFFDKFFEETECAYHISIRTVEDEFEYIKELTNKHGLNLKYWLVTYEFGKIEQNLHYHYHITVEDPVKMRKLDSILKTVYRENFRDKIKGCYYVKKVKSNLKHLLYIAKEYCENNMNIKHTNMSNELLLEIHEENRKINADKKLPMYKKLFLRYDREHGEKHLHDNMDITRFILKLYKEWDILFPNRSQMFQYINYIKSQYISIEEISNYYDI